MTTTVANTETTIQRNWVWNDKEKTSLKQVARAGGGRFAYISVAEAQASGSTTLGNSTCVIKDVLAGRVYQIEALAIITNATAVNGGKAGLDFSGTQSSATIVGVVDVTTELTGTLTYAGTNPTTGNVGVLADATAFGVSGTTGTGRTFIKFKGLFIPQNSCDITLQFASAGGATIATLGVGSYLNVIDRVPN